MLLAIEVMLLDAEVMLLHAERRRKLSITGTGSAKRLSTNWSARTITGTRLQIAQIYTDIVKTTKTTGTTAGNGSRERTAYSSKTAENGLPIAANRKPPELWNGCRERTAYSNKPAESGLHIAANQPRRAAVIQQQTERAGEG